MKYHIHVHSLITYGGLNNAGEWIYPTTKNKLDKYRVVCSTYKNIFLAELNSLITKGKINYYSNIDDLLIEVSKVRWVVHSTYPTMETNTIENYLAKYISRVAISNKRLDYIKDSEKVIITYNNYS